MTHANRRLAAEPFAPARLPSLPAAETAAQREQTRLRALEALRVLDTAPEEEYDELVKLASALCAAPIGLVSLVDASRQWFKASVGLEVRETHRNVSFCSHAIQNEGIFIVENATKDARFAHNALVTGDPNIRFYAGVPLMTEDHQALGTLCVIDTKPRVLTPTQQEALLILARQVQARFEMRLHCRQLEEALEANRRLTASLEMSRDTFRAFMNNGPFLGYIKDRSGRMLYYNSRVAETFAIDQNAWIGKSDHELWPEQEAEEFRRIDHQVLERRAPVEALEEIPLPDGARAFWKSYKFPIRHESGEWMLGGLSVDITAEQEREAQVQQALRAREEAYAELEANRRLLCAFDEQTPTLSFVKSGGRYVSYNQAFADFFKIGLTDWVGREDYEVQPAGTVDAARSQELQVMRSGVRLENCQTVQNMAGEEAVLRIVRFPVTGRNGERLIGGIAVDVTQDMLAQQTLETSNLQLQRLATTDDLTSLSTRRVFEERLKKEFASSELTGQPLSLLVLDIDDFKKRNDRFGHAAGDEALRLLGRMLALTMRQDDLAARIGGEEFALLLPRTDAEEAARVAERIRLALRAIPCESGIITASIGVDTRDQTTGSCERMVIRADDAMYRAKRSGKDRIVLYRDHQNDLLAEAAQAAAETAGQKAGRAAA